MAATHEVGTACELRFAADAILKGYDVYLPCVGTQKGHDIVICKDGVWQRVQVKKATVTRNNKSNCTYVTAALNGNRNTTIPKDQYDLLALVCLDMPKTWLLPVAHVHTEKTISKSLPKLSEWDRYLF